MTNSTCHYTQGEMEHVKRSPHPQVMTGQEHDYPMVTRDNFEGEHDNPTYAQEISERVEDYSMISQDIHSFDPDHLDGKAIYKLLIGSVIPRPVLTLVTQNQAGLVNIAPFSFFNMISYDPPLLMVSIQRKAGQAKDTAANLLAQGEGVGHVLTGDLLEEVNQTAASLPRDQSELGLTNLSLAPSQKVATPRLAQAKVTYEVKVHHHHTIANDQGQIVADIFYLRLVFFSIASSLLEGTYIKAQALDPIARLAGSDYAGLGQIISLPRPK